MVSQNLANHSSKDVAVKSRAAPALRMTSQIVRSCWVKEKWKVLKKASLSIGIEAGSLFAEIWPQTSQDGNPFQEEAKCFLSLVTTLASLSPCAWKFTQLHSGAEMCLIFCASKRLGSFFHMKILVSGQLHHHRQTSHACQTCSDTSRSKVRWSSHRALYKFIIRQVTPHAMADRGRNLGDGDWIMFRKWKERQSKWDKAHGRDSCGRHELGNVGKRHDLAFEKTWSWKCFQSFKNTYA